MNYSIHPELRTVIFEDTSCGKKFLIPSSVQTQDVSKWEDGNEYPLVRIDVSSSSHPAYTGERRVATSEGRIDKFNRKFAMNITAGKKKS